MVEATAKRFGLVEAEKGDVLRFLVEGGDLSKWGLCNAVTRLSQEATISYERATDLERLGGQIIELPPTESATSASGRAQLLGGPKAGN